MNATTANGSKNLSMLSDLKMSFGSFTRSKTPLPQASAFLTRSWVMGSLASCWRRCLVYFTSKANYFRHLGSDWPLAVRGRCVEPETTEDRIAHTSVVTCFHIRHACMHACVDTTDGWWDHASQDIISAICTFHDYIFQDDAQPWRKKTAWSSIPTSENTSM